MPANGQKVCGGGVVVWWWWLKPTLVFSLAQAEQQTITPRFILATLYNCKIQCLLQHSRLRSRSPKLNCRGIADEQYQKYCECFRRGDREH